MSSDEIVWQVINQQFCAFKLKTTKDRTFCRNEYNVTGLCSRQACPLANSRYATVRSNPESGQLYLCMKTVERAHLPNKLWERVRLSTNYARALEQIDELLKYWPKFLIHKCKQRLTRLTQVAIRTKKLMKEEERLGEHIVQKLAPKIRRREATRERRAEAAAKVERAIERELIERLRSGAYGDRPLNVEEGIWKKVLRGLERGGEGERDVDLDEGIESERSLEIEEELEGEGQVEYVSDIDGYSEDEDMEDLEDWFGEDSNDESGLEGSEEGDHGAESSVEQSDEDVALLKQNISSHKRKLSEQGLGKKPPKRVDKKPSKGPRKEIEYEVESVQPLRTN